MNAYLLTASLLIVATAVVHSVLGELWIIGKLDPRGLPALRGSRAATRRTLRFTWHVTSVLGLGIAAVVLYLASVERLTAEQTAVLRVISVTLFASFLVAIVGSRGRHPSWLVFLIVAGLVWRGAA